MSKSESDLKAAFAGESQANRRYLAFAKKAEEEGFPQIAKLFRAVAEAETVHALTHFKTMGGIGSTAENLKVAIAGENYEVNTMYPDFMADAEAEGDKKAFSSFHKAYEVEKIHEELYKDALTELEDGVEMAENEYYVCPVCGYTHVGTPPDKCPVCGASKERFNKVS